MISFKSDGIIVRVVIFVCIFVIYILLNFAHALGKITFHIEITAVLN